MKINFKLPDDGKVHEICIDCHADGVKYEKVSESEAFICSSCGKSNPRRIHVGEIKQWTEPDGTWWHESVGLLVRKPDNTYLFFDRNYFPFGFTYPSGHVDLDDEPDAAALRELEEETGIKTKSLKKVVTTDIPGDSCSRGADIHHFNIYLATVPEDVKVIINDEGKDAVWMTLEEAKANKRLIYPNRFIIEKFQKEIESA